MFKVGDYVSATVNGEQMICQIIVELINHGGDSNEYYLAIPEDHPNYHRYGWILPKDYASSDDAGINVIPNIKDFGGKRYTYRYSREITIAIKPRNKVDGCNCKTCKQYIHMAEPNQPDNQTFICYSCTNNPLRAYY